MIIFSCKDVWEDEYFRFLFFLDEEGKVKGVGNGFGFLIFVVCRRRVDLVTLFRMRFCIKYLFGIFVYSFGKEYFFFRFVVFGYGEYCMYGK